MTTAIAAIFVFFIVVIFHELGHFTVAKLVGIKVHEFSIGMGPRITKLKKGETEYSLRALPIGGYVKMEGEDEASEDLRSFSKKSVPARMAVLIAGAFMNFVLAVIVFSIISFNLGAPTTIIDKVNSDLPAYQAGLLSGDKITKINNVQINTWDEIVREINQSTTNKIEVNVLRNGEYLDFSIQPIVEQESNRRIIGISPEMKKSFIFSIKSGFERMIFVLSMMLDFFKMLFIGKVNANNIMGPIGIISVVGEAAKFGFLNVINIAGIISVNLGVFNLLPIPALDGSRIMFLFVELFRGKPVNPEREGFVHFIGFVFLILLMVVVLYNDLARLTGF